MSGAQAVRHVRDRVHGPRVRRIHLHRLAPRALGRRRLVLSTQPTMYAAQRVYERAGFTRAPGRDWSPVPGLVLMAYELDLTDS